MFQPQFRYHINIVRFLTVELDRYFEIIIGFRLPHPSPRTRVRLRFAFN